MTTPPLLRGPLLSESFVRGLAGRAGAGQSSPEAAWRAFGRWWARVSGRCGPATSPRGLLEAAEPLLRLLGFALVAESSRLGRGHAAAVTRTRRATRVPIVVCEWNAPARGPWRDAVSAATRLGAPWCLVFAGTSLGIVDAARPYARRHVAFSMAAVAASRAGFEALWATLRADRFDIVGGGSALDAIVAGSERHRALTCAAVDRGVRDAHGRLRAALAGTARRPASGQGPGVEEQALTVVFRMLFLLYAEARGLLPLSHPVFRAGYSMAGLREGLARPAQRGWWPALRAMMRMAHAGCRLDDLDVTAFNGQLFAPDRAPLVEHGHVPDQVVRAAVAALTERGADGDAGGPLPYDELGVEQLGAIYERLIDGPAEGASPGAAGSRRACSRKATGSFYTPVALTHFLVRRTLAPLVEGAAPEAVLGLRVLDPAMGSGAFLVAACHYLASAYERALVEAGALRAGEAGEADRAGFRRLVAQRCLFGVDSNPMAVQLARLSIWLTTLARDRPLSFLDHRLRVGDSLVGASLGDLARQAPGPGRRRRAQGALPLLADLDPVVALREGVGARMALALIPDDEARTVREKERRLDALAGPAGPLARWREAADTWCAAWFWPGRPAPSPAVFADLLAAALREGGSLPPARRAALRDAVRHAAEHQRFFHWPFEFPEVFHAADGRPRPDGGFDAVLGNPPWDMLRAEDGTPREQARRLVGFARESGLYSWGREAHVNRYQLFVERALDLLRDGGRIGLVVPWGLFGDAGAARVRRRLVEAASIDALVAFDNRKRLFPIHRSLRFVACTATRGGPTRALPCRMGETDVQALERIPDAGDGGRHFPVIIARAAIEALAGEGLAVPAVRDADALALLLRLAEAHPRLSDPRGWGARFGRELNATDDRADFVEPPPGQALARPFDGCPIVEGRHLSPFAVDLRAARWWLSPEARRRRATGRFERARLALRDVAAAGNRLTLIAAMLPPATASVHTVFSLETCLGEPEQQVLCALLNSLVANWYVRHWVSTHVTSGLVARLPVPRAAAGTPEFDALAALARRCGREGAEGDAWVATQVAATRLYDLAPADLDRVLATFPLIDAGLREAIAGRFRERRR